MYVYGKAVGSELRVQYLPTQKRMKLITRAKLLYNEVLKFWGSAIELGSCLVISELPLDSERFLNVRNVLKDI